MHNNLSVWLLEPFCILNFPHFLLCCEVKLCSGSWPPLHVCRGATLADPGLIFTTWNTFHNRSVQLLASSYWCWQSRWLTLMVSVIRSQDSHGGQTVGGDRSPDCVLGLSKLPRSVRVFSVSCGCPELVSPVTLRQHHRLGDITQCPPLHDGIPSISMPNIQMMNESRGSGPVSSVCVVWRCLMSTSVCWLSHGGAESNSAVNISGSDSPEMALKLVRHTSLRCQDITCQQIFFKDICQ